MSIRVELDELPRAVADRGAAAYLVTVSAEGRPKIVSVHVTVAAGSLRMAAGRGTRTNVRERPQATLLWPAAADHPHHSLLVDGEAVVDDEAEQVELRPAAAILHRSRDGDG
jgi:hypothetical protein